ncbi:hypothetical protein TGME49_259650 [Toxoplasma gondii ME49]|uniref:C2H2-type domain-containing protein n=3 Tax=Toxoplasma gondii TaxID=5811 RepID=A0A125YX91_TOXGM|nr:hypothetical protein TGME49_259650 [Toxoplasma gondii ME49]EPT29447.1 hypothetical protein TGME49_259650 [Toxoplasma gondii ME49]ESS32144.1 putative C2H2 type zinc-finger protein [Toxoplasma gondii VEG]KYF41619.1 putative C2H2 type zinc-finger protein [Toxoplasma gondii ARI]CEL74383.1 TPA: zinc finger (C2H2 type) protein, putative [Toxoplasma gondii VEG]|eukprot:XP_002365159.1 hypothetical protein TGME49_259650 [Toxoplasma gondii ME49]
MLKRAVFGISLPPTERRRSKLEQQKAGKAGLKPLRKKRFQGRQRLEERESDGSSEDEEYLSRGQFSGKEELPSSSDREEDSIEESEEEALDSRAKLALIKKAAALYATDPHSFFQSMKRHDADLTQFQNEQRKGSRGESTASGKRGPAEGKPARGRKNELQSERDDHSAAETSMSDDSDDEFALYDASSSDDPDGQDPEEDREEESQEQNFRGHFQCKLCPKKIFIFEADLERHLQSKKHLRREAEWEKEHGVPQEQEEESKERASASSSTKERRKKGIKSVEESDSGPSPSSRRSQKKGSRSQGDEFPTQTEAPNDESRSRKHKKAEGRDSPKGEGREQGEGVTKTSRRKKRQRRRTVPVDEEEIQKRKEKFQRKKARRLARKNGLAATPAAATPQ